MRPGAIWRRALLVVGILSAMTGVGAEPVSRIAVGQAFVAPAAAGFWVGRDRGLFAKHGLDVEITQIQGSTMAIQGLLAGSLQVMLGAPAQGLSAAAAGGDVISVATLGPRMPYLLVARSELRSPADLKGKTVGVSSVGASSDRVAQLLAFKHLNLDPKRDGINMLVIGPQAQRVQALAAGRIDATALDPLQRALAERVGMVVLSDLGKLDIPWDHDVVLLRRDFARSQPAVVDALLKALLEANAFILNPANKRAVMPVLAKELKLDQDQDVELAYTLTTSLYVVRKPYPSQPAAQALVDALRAELPQLGQVALATHVDGSFLRKLDESGFIDQLYK